MKKSTKGKLIKAFAVTIDVSVPLIATFSQFPVWVERSSDATVSGLFLVFAFLSVLPFIKQIKSFLRSPSIWIAWIVFCLFLICLRNIIDEMIVVCFAGAVSNTIGAGIYAFGSTIEKAKENADAANINVGN